MVFHGMAVIRAQPAEIRAGDNVEHTGPLTRCRNVDRNNAGVRVGASQHLGPDHPVKFDITGVDGPPCHFDDAVGPWDGMVYDTEIARLLHWRVLICVAARRTALTIGRY